MRGVGMALRVASAPPRARVFDFSGGTLPAGAVLTRATQATRVRGDGVIETVGPDVARFDHDPATGALLGLLIEPERTNLMTSGVGQGPVSCTIAGGIDDPAGGTGAVRITVTDADPYLQSEALGLAPKGRTITATKYVRLPGGGSARGGFFAIPSDYVDVRFNDYPVDGAWRRFAQTLGGFSSDAPGFITRLDPFDGAGGTNTPPAGAAMDTAFWQVELAAEATSYIPIVGNAPTTRAADVLTLDWARRGVPDGTATVRYVFDDDSRADVAMVVAGGRATVPSTLPRHHIRRAIAL